MLVISIMFLIGLILHYVGRIGGGMFPNGNFGLILGIGDVFMLFSIFAFVVGPHFWLVCHDLGVCS